MKCACTRDRIFAGIASTLRLVVPTLSQRERLRAFARMTQEFKVDFERGARIGLDEALFCESKTVDQISAIMDAVRAKTGRMLLTRLDRVEV